MINRHFVIAKIGHTGLHPRLGPEQTIPINLVIRHGFSDFENDGTFNSINESIVVKNTRLSSSIRKQDWYYNSSTEEFQETQP